MSRNTYAQRVLTTLLGIDTTQSSGSERPAAEYLIGELKAMGVAYRLFEPVAGRTSVVGILPGKSPQTVVLHSHLDTADAHPAEWKFPPIAATVHGGRLYGRGALDCKGLCAAHLAVLRRLVSESTPPERTVLFVAVAGEEGGGEMGTRWILENTELFRDMIIVLGEGGGYRLQADGEVYWTVQTGERRRLTIRDGWQPAQSPEESVLRCGVEAGFYSEATLEYVAAKEYSRMRLPKSSFVEPVSEITAGGHRICSLLPFGYREIPAEEDRVAEVVETGGSMNLTDQLRRLQAALQAAGEKGRILPFVTPGYSDNRHFRLRGIPTLGFFPVPQENPVAGIHGPNEYIDLDALHKAVQVLYHTVCSFAHDGN